MKIFILSLILLLIVGCTQKIIIPSTVNKSHIVDFSKKDTLHFPEGWLGNWIGNLEIVSVKGVTQQLPIELEMARTDTPNVFIWAITYGEDKVKGRRDYLLRVKDATKGHYIHDEKNSIYLDAFLIGNRLISDFAVEGTHLTSTYERVDDKMIFDIVFGDEKVLNTSGNTIEGSDTIPSVKSFKTKGYQRSILIKK
jgi:hypothetical protein